MDLKRVNHCFVRPTPTGGEFYLQNRLGHTLVWFELGTEVIERLQGLVSVETQEAV